MSLEKKSNYLDSCCNTSLVWKIEKKHKSNKQNGSQNKKGQATINKNLTQHSKTCGTPITNMSIGFAY